MTWDTCWVQVKESNLTFRKMEMADTRILRILLFAIVLCAGAAFLVPARPAFAEPPAVPPAQTPNPPPPTPPPAGGGDPITQIINQIIQFPFENLVEALQNAAKSILTGTITPLETFFSASIGKWLTSSPGIITPGGGIANGDDVMGPAWRLMVKVAVLMWPLTLAIIAAIAAKDAVAAASWGIGDLKEALGGWLIAVVFSATSLYWMDLANRFTNATTMTILNMSFTGEAGFQPNALTALVFGTAGIVLTMVSMPASLIIVIFVILMGLSVLSALIFQFLARFVILYILVALAPVVIILGVLPPLSWFRYMWIRGLIMVEAIGPINALLLKLVMILTVRGTSNDPITAFVNFIGAIGVLSILLTIDGVIIKGVFGAAEEVMQKAVSTVQALGTLAIAGVTALAGGAIAGGAVGAAGTTAAGGATGGAGATAASATSAPSTATRAGAAGAGGPASVARNAFSPSAALRGAGDVLFRQPGMLGSVGAAMRSVGGTMEKNEREDQAQGRWASNQGGNQTSGPGGGSGPGSNSPNRGTSPRNPNSPTGGTPTSNAPSSPRPSSPSSSSSPQSSLAVPGSAPTASGKSNLETDDQSDAAPSSRRVAPSSQASTPSPLTSTPSMRNAADASASVPSSAAAPSTPTRSEDRRLPSSDPGAIGASLPPPQSPSVSPMGAPLASPSSPMSAPPSVSQPARVLSREAVDAVGTLPSPLGERAGAFASVYSNPREQAVAARAAVDAFNQVSARGQGFADLSQQGSAWDRSMPPVIASARQGLPLETMAQDAGFGGNVPGFLAGRMLDNRPPTLDVPTQAVPWHPQMAPHDWETGAAVSNALGNRISQGAAARVYHEIRSPETGGGWSAGAQFVQNVQEIFQRAPIDPIAALEGRLNEMEARGAVSPRAMTLWRANAKSKT
jgi:hypothetical protein